MHVFTRSGRPRLWGQVLLSTLFMGLVTTSLVGNAFAVNSVSGTYRVPLPFVGGTGTENDPYQIANVDQLQAMKDYLDSYFILIADIDASATAGWNSGAGFEPVGKLGTNTQFVGSFDGNGKKITGLKINRPTADPFSYTGLFGVVGTISDPAEIINVALEGVNVNGYNNVGGLAGSIQPGSTVEECYVTGSVSGSSYVGGLVGFTSSGSIIHSYATASVSGTGTTIGGLVGFNAGPLVSCYATGSVSGGSVVGGLAGLHNIGSTITSSYAMGSLSGSTEVGGLVGNAQGTITHGYWNTTTSGRVNAVGSGSSAGATGLSDSQFKLAASFSGFDFINDWAVDEGLSYPYLRDEPATVEISPDAAGILYVNKNVAGGNRSGDSWENAIPQLSEALQWANENWNTTTDGTLQIWVAKGKYLPTNSTSDRVASFQLVRGVEIYGGFPDQGTPTMDDRDWKANATILSGDIDANDDEDIINDPTVQIKGNNSFHVVIGVGITNTAVLDGFIITGGNANQGTAYLWGGGVRIIGGNPVLTNLAITGNRAYLGAGMYSSTSASPTLTDVTISNNHTVNATNGEGGGIYSYGSHPVLTHVVIENNWAANNGGGMNSQDNSRPTLTDVTIRNNTAVNSGGGLYVQNGTPKLTDVVISDNSSAYAGGVMLGDANAEFNNVTIRDNTATTGQAGGIAVSNATQKPVFTNVVISGNSSVTSGGGLYNSGNVAAVFTDVSFTGNVSGIGGGIANISPSAVFTNVIVSGNSATNQGGGIYNSGTSTFANVVVSGNTAANQGGGVFNAGTSNFTNVTISGNSAGANGGGIYSHNAYFKLANSIVWNNRAGGGTETASASIYNYTNSYPYNPSISYSAVANSFDDSDNWVGTIGVNDGNNMDADPLFEEDVDLTDLPTIHGNLRLTETSKAVNAGSNVAYTTAGGKLADDLDLDGNTRVYNHSLGGIIDLGAYESEFGVINRAPEAIDVSFTGTLNVRLMLTGSYTFDDPDGDEDKSTFKWYRSDDAAGTNKTAIDGAIAKTYALQAEDKGKYISFEVTPNDGSVDGPSVESDIQGPIGEAGPIPGSEWALRTPAPEGLWNSVAYGNGLFVAASYGGTNRIMTSPDGVNWTAQVVPENNAWQDITFADGKFVAVAQDGTNRVMTSTDGIHWEAHAAAEDRSWRSVTYGNGKFVAVAFEGGEGNHVMISENGTDWTSVLGHKGYWLSVTYGAGQFVALSTFGSNYIMTSADGENWTVQNPGAMGQWAAVTYGADRFVAVSSDGNVMISTDGVNWSGQTAHAGIWMDITYGDGQFVAVSRGGDNQVMTSPDGTDWTVQTPAVTSIWAGITNSNGLFVAVSRSAPSVMTSGTPPTVPNTPPVISDLTVDGLLEVGDRLSANYTYSDADEDPEASIFAWYRYDAAAGDVGKTRIEGATSATYVLSTTDLNKWISVEVLPSDGEDEGTAVESPRVGPVVTGSNIRFVKAQNSGGIPTGTGLDWGTACSDLQAMIDVLAAKGGGEVWVAAGTYFAPDTSFRMKNGVAIYGGFSGNEASLDERDWAANTTILSGSGSRRVMDNTYTAENPLTATAILDGFTLTNGVTSMAFGSGIANSYASPMLRNLIISKNEGAYKGGGIANVHASSPTLINVVLQNNRAGSYGGGLSSDVDSHPLLINVIIKGNFSDGGGGGLTATDNASITLINTVITGNVARGGGAIYVHNSELNIINTTISGNVAGDAGIVVSGTSTATLQNNLVWGNGPTDYKGEISASSGKNLIGGLEGHNLLNGEVYAGTPADLFVDYQPAMADIPTVAGNYHLVGCSPAINGGDNARYPGGLDSLTTHSDVAGNPRLAWDTVDMGAFEYGEVPTPRLVVPADSMYKIGDELIFTINFHQPMVASDVLALPLTVGGQSRTASVVGTSDNGHEISFGYTVAEGDEDADGIDLGVDADLSYCPVSTVGIHIDGVRPKLEIVSIASDNAMSSVAKIGNKIVLTFTASKPLAEPVVKIAGNPAVVNALGADGLQWQAEYELTEGDEAGTIDFMVNGLVDFVGNTGSNVVMTTDESSVTFYKVPPVVTGVSDGEVYNQAVTPAFNEGTATLNGQPFTSGTVVTEDGEYTLVVTDEAGNETVVRFTIDRLAPDTTPPVVTGVSDGEVYNQAVTPAFNEGTATLNGQPFTSGTAVTEEGEYTLVVTDEAGNETVVKFKISVYPEEPVKVPGVPTGLSAIAGDRQVKLRWQSPQGSVQPIVNYVIQYSYDDGQTWTTAEHAPLVDTQAVVIGLDNNRSYRFRIAAENVAGMGAFSAELAGIIPTKPVPNADGEFPEPEPGETVVITEGGVEAITLEVIEGEYLRLHGEGYAIELASLGMDGERIPISAIDAVIRLIRGVDAAVYVSGSGFEPGTVVTVYLFSVPELVGHIPVGTDGRFAGTLTVPMHLEPGRHTLQANGIVAGGKGERSVSVGLLLVDNKPQRINFGMLADRTYGDKPVTLDATASSGLPVRYVITDMKGDLTDIAEIESDNRLRIHGAGDIQVIATQSGDLEYAAAVPVIRVLRIAKTPLTVGIPDATRAYGESNPAFVISYNGFVNGDNPSSLETQPQASTEATEGSVPGSYAIAVSGGKAANYAFTYQEATLTVTKAQQAITFSTPSEVNRNVGSIQLAVSAGSGLPVMLSLDDDQVATLSDYTLHIHRLGTVNITATQVGDGNYEAADPVTVTLRVVDPSADFAVRVHPAVSPNGDGVNEFLMVEGIRDYRENRVTVINRNGTVLWEASGYDNDRIAFRGISTGQEQLPAGTYFYIVEVKVNGMWEHKKGYFVLRY
ncbi:hypothetical protein GCM10011386_34390 [Parapedobacter defluvii]|uniref:Fibronectin type-III domain-containing protein n=1 Tax=Parapedobacter defluvii TaxID=2045106 RepID=A0ABQ1MEK0_9SPHI|nr:MBG domain-containing protein [Parapedobacter defluvii]GGC39442.1 hypothetical protein GCM10011386_34390 [Parapedobacter defluvii]